MYKVLVVPALIICDQKVRLALPPLQERIRGIYENKIRYNAPPEKCFEIFASLKENNYIIMSENDFFRSLVPYNYSKKKNMGKYFKEKPSKVFSIFDLDNSGTIDFSEYMFFISLLSVPTKEWQVQFEQQGDELTKEQLDQLLQNTLIKDTGKKSTNSGYLPDPRAVSITEEQYRTFISELINTIFPIISHRKSAINFQDFQKLRQMFFDELAAYEFYSYPVEEDSISLEDFGKSIISYVHFKKTDTYLKHLQSKKFEGKVNFHQFISFNRIFQEIPKLLGRVTQEQLETHIMAINEKQFNRMIRELKDDIQIKTEFELEVTDEQIQVLFELLDIDDSGSIESEELFGVLFKRSYKGQLETVNPSDVFEKIQSRANEYAKICYGKFIWFKELAEEIYEEWKNPRKNEES